MSSGAASYCCPDLVMHTLMAYLVPNAASQVFKCIQCGKSEHCQYCVGGRSLEALKEYVERALQELTMETTA